MSLSASVTKTYKVVDFGAQGKRARLRKTIKQIEATFFTIQFYIALPMKAR
jgi:hypothetical protein